MRGHCLYKPASIFELPKKPIEFVGDPEKLNQVLGNLLTNVKYSDEGKPIYVTGMIFGDDVQISVRDEGMGIPKTSRQIYSDNFFAPVPGASELKAWAWGYLLRKK